MQRGCVRSRRSFHRGPSIDKVVQLDSMIRRPCARVGERQKHKLAGAQVHRAHVGPVSCPVPITLSPNKPFFSGSLANTCVAYPCDSFAPLQTSSSFLWQTMSPSRSLVCPHSSGHRRSKKGHLMIDVTSFSLNHSDTSQRDPQNHNFRLFFECTSNPLCVCTHRVKMMTERRWLVMIRLLTISNLMIRITYKPARWLVRRLGE